MTTIYGRYYTFYGWNNSLTLLKTRANVGMILMLNVVMTIKVVLNGWTLNRIGKSENEYLLILIPKNSY